MQVKPPTGRSRPALLIGVLLSSLGLPVCSQSAPLDSLARLPQQAPLPLMARSRLLGRLDSAAPVRVALSLPLRNRAGLDGLLPRLYDPTDPLYGHYLTPAEFTAQFGPTTADYAAVAGYARAQGLSVVGAHSNRLLLDVEGPAGAVETAFGVRLSQYQGPDGRLFRAPDTALAVPAALAGRVDGVFGLDTARLRHPQLRRVTPQARPFAQPIQGPGTGPEGGLTPSDAKTAYGLNGMTLDGTGQTLAVFELSDYNPNDIRSYETTFGLPRLTLNRITVDGGVTDTADQDESTLDIELIAALAPRASAVEVYEGPNSDSGILDTYNRIATDDQAKQISTCWGFSEGQNDTPFLNGENKIFMQMAAQGQTIFAAAGDNGAYDDGDTTHLSVDDPGSQPYVTDVGGTSLTTFGPGDKWSGETTWNNLAADNPGNLQGGASGGGVSSFWSIPSYQQLPGVITPASLGSTTMRNVPDVALNADPNVGYSIYFQGGWVVYGGTSTAAPLWAGFTALVNQQRLATNQSALGFANPLIYDIGAGQPLPSGRIGNYSADFHDIADGSSNGIAGNNPAGYPAVTGYDLATGWGTMKGAGLLADLAGTSAPARLTAPFSYPAGLNLLSLPDTYSGDSLDALFGGTYPYYVWQPAAGKYSTLTAPPAQPGSAYWVTFPQTVSVTNSGNSVLENAPLTFPLSAGWNQIGDPFSSQVAVANLQILLGGQTDSFLAASGGTPVVSSVLYRYDNPSGQYVPVGGMDALAPGTGYWLYATQPVTLQVPPP